MSFSFADYFHAETYVFWDMDECKIPNDLDIKSLYKNIKSALANEGYHGKVSIRGYGTKNHIGDELLPEGFSFLHERKKGNRRDFEISGDYFWEIDMSRSTPYNLMPIVHDNALPTGYKRNNVNILVAQNVINVSLVQKVHATSVWLWKSLSSGGRTTALNEIVPALNISLTAKKTPCVQSENETIMISESIPNELILEILSRLPAKSVARFACVSKLWASIVGRPYFSELFLTRSSARPRLLFALQEDGVWSFFSLPQHQNLSSHVVTADFHMKFPPDNMRIYSHRSRQFSCGYASGLFYLYAMWIKKEDYDGVPVICNPNTGRYANLPYLYRFRQCYSFLGFDPVDKQFKVLFMTYPSGPDHNKILTFGTGELSWRRIKCSIKHEIVSEGICINGILYYLGDREDWGDYENNYVIVCFDVRSEKFKFIFLETFVDRFINYKGKLGVIFNDHYTKDAKELRLWVLEDVEKQEWTKYAYTLRYDQFFSRVPFVVGVTATGEIVLSMGEYTREEPFYVYYFNPERNTMQRVEIQGFGEYHKGFRNQVYTFVDHIEDLNCVNDSKLLQPRIYAPYVHREDSESEEEE